jgi:hypothetical protein
MGYNIRMGLRETGWEGVDWIHLAKDKDHWLSLVNTVIAFKFHKKLGIS